MRNRRPGRCTDQAGGPFAAGVAASDLPPRGAHFTTRAFTTPTRRPLDQRLNRCRAEARARDRRVLDLFWYRGEWSLHAVRGGARAVLAVDSSEAALAAAARNLERNALGERVTLKRADGFDAAREVERERERFGLVVLDPPAFVKSRCHLAAGARAYRELNRAVRGAPGDLR